MTPLMQKYSCVACARRKVKCDKLRPCSNCSRSKSECVFRAPALSQRHQKRPADEELLSKIDEYEELLRKNNIKFQPLDNSWIPSSLEEKLISTTRAAPSSSCALLQTPSELERALEAQGPEKQSEAVRLDALSDAARLWSALPKELRDASIDLKRLVKDGEDELEETKTNSGLETALLMPLRLSGAAPLLEMHPAPRHIFRLWQVFAETVNPLTKIIHAPTLQQKILETSWNLETVTKPLEAVMFSVYALAVTAMKPSSCVQSFGETRSVLLNRYRSAAAQALIAAELHSTREVEVLQAFVLYLLLDPQSELSVTTVAIATRIGHKMGLHRTGTDSHTPFFEQEMRLRVWWQIIGLESRVHRKILGLKSPMTDFGDVRLPLNVNDAELHPSMSNLPAVAHSRATEMLYCLLKYEIGHYIRSWLATAAIHPHELFASTSLESMEKKRIVLTDLAQIYEDKYLLHCDPSIPLHQISAATARITLHRVRFWSYHPRHQPEGGRHMSQADQDDVFESAVRLLQNDDDLRAAIKHFSAHLLEHMPLTRTKVEALVYMISELRIRVSGELVRTAWALVEKVYEEYQQLLQDDDKFNTALADLTLSAWEAYKRETEAPADSVPAFIGWLKGMRGNVEPENIPAAEIETLLPNGGFQFGLMDDDPLDWVYWNELPQL